MFLYAYLGLGSTFATIKYWTLKGEEHQKKGAPCDFLTIGVTIFSVCTLISMGRWERKAGIAQHQHKHPVRKAIQISAIEHEM